MIDKTLTNYDYIAFQIYWEGTKKLNQDSRDPYYIFMRSFFSKYQILVLTEPGYRRDDQMNRIHLIIKNTPELKGKINMTNSTTIRNSTENLFNQDLRIILGKGVKAPFREKRYRVLTEAVMGVNGNKEQEKIDKKIASKAARYYYSRTIKGKTRSRNDRDNLIKQASAELNNSSSSLSDSKEKLSAEQYQRLMADRGYAAIQQLNDDVRMAMNVQLEHLRRQTEIVETKTQMDGDKGIEVLDTTKKMQKDMRKLLDATQGGQDWSQISVGDLPRWFKNKCIAGMKRVAIGTVTFPLWGPVAIINGTVVRPLKLVKKRVGQFMDIIQEIWGWMLVAMFIGGVWVIMYHPDYGEERKQIVDWYDSATTYIPVWFFQNPVNKTFKILWKVMPGQQFLKDVGYVVGQFLLSIPKILIGWFASLLSFFAEIIKNSVKASMGWGDGTIIDTVEWEQWFDGLFNSTGANTVVIDNINDDIVAEAASNSQWLWW